MFRIKFIVAFGVVGLIVFYGYAKPQAAGGGDEPFIVVLGVAQDAGYPQIGCEKDCCREVWEDTSKRKYVSCLAIVDPISSQRWIIDATPDFKDQLRLLDEVAPSDEVPGLDGILLTHGHIGHYTGLMQLGHEAMGAKDVPVYAMLRMRKYLSTNGPWDQLVQYNNIKLRAIEADQPVKLNERITITPILVPHREEYTEVVGYKIEGPNKSILFIPDIDKWERWDRSIEKLIREVDIAYLDGTFYDGGELPNRNMADIPHPFISESIKRFEQLPVKEKLKIRFIHFNHTNPVLREDSDAQRAIKSAGFGVAMQLKRTQF